MKIKRIISQVRRDFLALFECEHCGHEHEESGYDDDFFHRKVIPQMPCPVCDEVSPPDYRPMGTKYPEGQVV